MKIIFDLDGTLICSKKRLYALFCFLAPDNKLSFSDYWNLKFSGQSNQNILTNLFNYSNAEVTHFSIEWMNLIESEKYLEMDTIDSAIPSYLVKLQHSHELYLCTARQSVVKAIAQLKLFSIYACFHQVFVTEQKYSKVQMLKDSNIQFSDKDWIVGDTGHDILTGKALGINTCAVLSGFMSENGLLKYKPDLILSNVLKFKGPYLESY
jgi:phosphoglycolate phosphatase